MRWILILALVVIVVGLGYFIMWWRSAPMEPWRHRRHSTLDLRERAGADAPIDLPKDATDKSVLEG